MKIGKRNISLLFIFDRRHYLALFNILFYCKKPVDFFLRYFLSKGSYPTTINIKTPEGLISPTIYFYDDSLTVNEIFFRLDYKAGKNLKTFVDIGANIGISALYFLTRNNFSKGYLYEPVPANLDKLEKNLVKFRERVEIKPLAVYTDNLNKKFGVEKTGRLGGINRKTDEFINVNCININQVLENVLQKEKFIDILKIDIEGDELIVVKAIDKKYFNKIGLIYFDIDYTLKIDKDLKILDDNFEEFVYGSTYVLKNKN